MAGVVLGWAGHVAVWAGVYLLCEHVRRGAGFCALLAAALMTQDITMIHHFGMETPLMTGLGLLAIWLHASGRGRWLLGVLMAVALLLRPDAVFLGLTLVLSYWAQRRVTWREALAFSALIGLWVALGPR